LTVDQPALTPGLLLVSGVIRLLAATSEQFGKIAHWVETHSLERMSLIALLAQPNS
jgi:hypothetical protein